MPRPYPSGLRSNLPRGECVGRDTQVGNQAGVQLVAVLRAEDGRGMDRREHPLGRHRYGVGLARPVEQPTTLLTALEAGTVDRLAGRAAQDHDTSGGDDLELGGEPGTAGRDVTSPRGLVD